MCITRSDYNIINARRGKLRAATNKFCIRLTILGVVGFRKNKDSSARDRWIAGELKLRPEFFGGGGRGMIYRRVVQKNALATSSWGETLEKAADDTMRTQREHKGNVSHVYNRALSNYP